MKNTLENIKVEFETMNKLPIFEVEVLNFNTQELEYLIFNISIKGKKLIATHIALNEVEEESPKVAYKDVKIDSDFSLDSNLENLYNECIEAIIESTFFEII